MKIMLSHRFTGEDPSQLKEVLKNICDRLAYAGHNVFCSFFLEDFFRKEGMETDAIYEYCLKEQEKCDLLVALVKSEHPSKGMNLELEKAQELKQKTILLIKNNLGFAYFRSVANQIINFDSFPQLYQKIEQGALQ